MDVFRSESSLVPLPWLSWPSFYRARRRPRATQKEVEGFLAGRNPFPSAWRQRGCFSSMRVHVLSLSLFRKSGGSALTPPPTKTEAHPSSWSPSLLVPSAHIGVLILFCTCEAFGSSLAACRTAEPRDLLVSSNAPERGWTRRQPTRLPGSCCAMHVFVRRWGGPSPVLASCLA